MRTIASPWRKTPTQLVCLALLLLFAVAMASAQTVVNSPTSTTLWAGAQDATITGGTVSFPAAGVILSGTAISTITGNPVRHLWYGDHISGLCRMDPEVDAIVPATNGIGGHAPTLTTCIASVKAAAFRPGQLSFDSSTNTLYAPDISPTSNGIVRLHFLPSGDSGQGAIDPVHIEVLVSAVGGISGTGGCTPPNDPFNGIVPSQADASALGPDGNLYVGFKLDGVIFRILSPTTFNPALSGVCQNNLQVPLFSADEIQNQAGNTYGLGWVGHFLFGADNIAPWVLANADQCLTPINGNKRCGPAGTGGTAPTHILSTIAPMVLGGASSDAQYPTFPGNTVYFGATSTVTKVTNIVSATNLAVQGSYGSPTGGFCVISGLTADPLNLANENLYVGVDCTDARTPGTGAVWQVTPATVAPAPPAVPTSVTAVGGNAQATVSWLPTPNQQPITSYVVRTLLGDGTASTIADLTVLATPPSTIVPTTATVTGLTNGSSYEFEVQACNNSGCSAFSSISNFVVLIAPGAPTGVTAVAGNASAAVAWLPAPSPAGVPPTTTDTISAFDTLTPTVLAATATVPGGSGGVIAGLITGECYTFTVHATNAVGISPESAPSLPVCIVNLSADIGVSVTAPFTITAGSTLTFSVTVSNFGAGDAAGVSLTDTLSAPLASFTTTQGTCQGAVGATSFSCNLGPMKAGTTANVTVSVVLPITATGLVTNSATVAPLDANGAPVADPLPGNNTASATVSVLPPPSTDIQVGGTAQNGGPAVGSTDTYTWQIKNNLGTTAAPGVVFTSTLPASFRFVSASPTQGTCTTPAAGSLGGTVTCNLGTLNGGGQAIVTVSVVPTVAGTFATTGSASFLGNDTNPANNSFTVTIQPK